MLLGTLKRLWIQRPAGIACFFSIISGVVCLVSFLSANSYRSQAVESAWIAEAASSATIAVLQQIDKDCSRWNIFVESTIVCEEAFNELDFLDPSGNSSTASSAGAITSECDTPEDERETSTIEKTGLEVMLSATFEPVFSVEGFPVLVGEYIINVQPGAYSAGGAASDGGDAEGEGERRPRRRMWVEQPCQREAALRLQRLTTAAGICSACFTGLCCIGSFMVSRFVSSHDETEVAIARMREMREDSIKRRADEEAQQPKAQAPAPIVLPPRFGEGAGAGGHVGAKEALAMTKQVSSLPPGDAPTTSISGGSVGGFMQLERVRASGTDVSPTSSSRPKRAKKEKKEKSADKDEDGARSSRRAQRGSRSRSPAPKSPRSEGGSRSPLPKSPARSDAGSRSPLPKSPARSDAGSDQAAVEEVNICLTEPPPIVVGMVSGFGGAGGGPGKKSISKSKSADVASPSKGTGSSRPGGSRPPRPPGGSATNLSASRPASKVKSSVNVVVVPPASSSPTLRPSAANSSSSSSRRGASGEKLGQSSSA